MPLQATSGAASYDAFGGGVPVVPNYIEDVFSTYLYTGNGTSQTITNGIDLSTKGGLVWIKDRSATTSHGLFDTARGVNNYLSSNSANEQNVFGVVTNALTAFNSNGFSVGTSLGWLNASGDNIASWTFRKQPKFFDVVTYTGNGINNRVISHSLGSVPGCIIFKATNTTSDWIVYHRSLYQDFAADNVDILKLNSTAAQTGVNAVINDVSATTFTLGNNVASNAPNIDGATYVAYLFAHDAGGFGLTGTDNVISCGSWSASGNNTITLGYEPQWILLRRSDGIDDWQLFDTMRGLTTTVSESKPVLYPNLSSAEDSLSGIGITSTGFVSTKISGTYIYIAIRRGPMKVPTSGTSVFNPYVTTSVSNNGSGYGTLYSTGLVTDIVIQRDKSGTDGWYMGSRLQGPAYMKTETTAAEVSSSAARYDSNIGAWGYNASYGVYAFKRAPSAFDVVCYTGTGADLIVNHNLGVQPEFSIIKRRNSTSFWRVVPSVADANAGNGLSLQTNGALTGSGPLLGVSSTTFTAAYVDGNANFSASINGGTYVAYLFATCAGVSKVGSYTGTEDLRTINCGFTSGARFVLIKRIDIDGYDWFVYDTARGMTSGNDPYLRLNTTAAEVTNTNYVDTDSTGFKITAAAPASLNALDGTYIFLAIA